MQIETDHKKEFNLFIARSGVGKTFAAHLILRTYDKPKIVIDECMQFKHDLEFDYTDLLTAFNDTDFRESFYKYKKTIVLRLGKTSANTFFKKIMNDSKFHDLVIFVDEIDLVLEQSTVNNDHGFYEFVNRGRHKDLDLVATCRNTANIPKCLIGQTDYFFISDLIEKGALDFVRDTLKGMEVITLIPDLKEYEFLKIDVNNKKVLKFTTKREWIEYFD